MMTMILDLYHHSQPASFYDSIETDPCALVGYCILHRFVVDDDQERWYEGSVLDYDVENKEHIYSSL